MSRYAGWGIGVLIWLLVGPADAADVSGAGGGGPSTDTLDTVYDRGKSIDGANSFVNSVRILDANGDGTAWYTDPTEGAKQVCVDNNTENACTAYDRKLAAGQSVGVKNASNTDIFRVTNDTGAMTGVTLDGAGSGNTITLYQKICGGDVAGLNPTDGTAQHVWNKDPLSTAPTLTAASGTNRGTAFLTFPDADGDYGVQITCEMPALSGTVNAVIWWNTTGTGNARFQIATKFYASNDADDASFNTASVVTAAAGTSGMPNRQALSGLTVTGIGPDRLGRFRFFRNRTEASDTLSAALNVEKVEIWGHVQY